MSHKRSIKGSFIDLVAVERVCSQKGYPCRLAPEGQTIPVKLYSSQEVKAVAAVRLPGWKYEIGITREGDLELDNYNGMWGEEKYLNDFRVDYNSDVVQRTYEQEGFRLESQQVLSNGDLQLVFSE